MSSDVAASEDGQPWVVDVFVPRRVERHRDPRTGPADDGHPQLCRPTQTVSFSRHPHFMLINFTYKFVHRILLGNDISAYNICDLDPRQIGAAGDWIQHRVSVVGPVGHRVMSSTTVYHIWHLFLYCLFFVKLLKKPRAIISRLCHELSYRIC